MSRLIDADALIKSVQGYNDAGWLEEQVDKQPTVDAVPVLHAHWVSEINSYGETTAWHCSNCYERTGFFTTGQSNYCPECGAKMDEKSTEERANEM